MGDRPNVLVRYRNLLTRGSTVAMGLVLAFGFAAGIVFWGGFNTVLEATNTEAFCIGCHSMKDNVYQEYKTSIHYSNRSDVGTLREVDKLKGSSGLGAGSSNAGGTASVEA